MRNSLVTGAAAISLALMPQMALAQSDVPGSTNSISDKRDAYKMNDAQKSAYEAWLEDRRADYDSWPYDYQVYFWSLEPAYQEGYWILSPEQRLAIYNMTEAQQREAWASVMKQMKVQPATTASATTFVSKPMVQGDMAPKLGHDYPICKGDVQDGCINPRAAGKNWGNRPLDYWPGKPASEM